MKEFKQPEVEVVHFTNADVLTSSPCATDGNCKPCPGCPPGSDECVYYETCPKYVCDKDLFA